MYPYIYYNAVFPVSGFPSTLLSLVVLLVFADVVPSKNITRVYVIKENIQNAAVVLIETLLVPHYSGPTVFQQPSDVMKPFLLLLLHLRPCECYYS